MQPYAARVDKDFVPDYHGNIFDDIFEQYERVIIESLITSFGLDFIVKEMCIRDREMIGPKTVMRIKNTVEQAIWM